jgi:hypothetical protein
MDKTQNHDFDQPPAGWFSRLVLGQRIRQFISRVDTVTSALSDDGTTASFNEVSSAAGFTTEPADLRGVTGSQAGETRVHDGSGSATGSSAGEKTWQADGVTSEWFDGQGNSFS